MVEMGQKELNVTHGLYAYVMSIANKCKITVSVGPTSKTVSSQERPVRYNPETGNFDDCNEDIEAAVCQFVTAREGDYVVLDNPATDPEKAHPPIGQDQELIQLDYGRRVIIRGHTTFALWPGQVADVIKGHRLRSNEYLVVRVINSDAARENWEQRVEKPQMSGGADDVPSDQDDGAKADDTDEAPSGDTELLEPPAPPSEPPEPEESASGDGVQYDDEGKPVLTNGQLLVIKGTDVSFYIPPTGIEVVKEGDRYVRDAVTLEQLEYCILLDESGVTRYVHGHAVVFPSPTETFVEEQGSKKYRAIELNEIQGIYVKVIEEYIEGGETHFVGDELFITGKEQMIYFPRREHNLIRYGNRTKHFAVEIPPGSAHYALDRMGGAIRTEKGPCMFLPDPRKEILVTRVLDPRTVELWYPGNEEALQWNRMLQEIAGQQAGADFVTERTLRQHLPETEDFEEGLDSRRDRRRHAGVRVSRDGMQRGDRFTPPMTIPYDPRFVGAPTVDVWNGYAVQVVKKNGERRVVKGPKTIIMEFDEVLGVLALSRGKPKSSKDRKRTVYLRVTNNKVSDLIKAETADLVEVNIDLAFRVNFDEEQRCFDVEDYVDLLCDHLRSLIRGVIKRQKIEQFYEDAVSIIRDAVLGKAEDGQGRPGRSFEENGMRVYDVEVLDVRIQDKEIAHQLLNAQRAEVAQMLELSAARSRLEATKEREEIAREIADAKHKTEVHSRDLSAANIEGELELALKELESAAKRAKQQHADQLEQQEALDKLDAAELLRARKRAEQANAIERATQEIMVALLQAKTDAATARIKAIQPELVAAIKLLSKQALCAIMAEKLPQATGTLGLLSQAGGIKGLMAMVKDTPLESGFQALAEACNAVGDESQPDEDEDEEFSDED